ncbi:methylated-DNA--[protein]-cysteine S-methyltransferase [Methyloversatilis sp. XJ19-49]|uniref:methylated-DNA--[protein]-cysteine S-methyltransferase n=1 Tax=Methyloversatilis sp. XJ19-49 TaxID=2963429 RepID=UPI00211CED5A|nr:methylated-DNA--[protein]-cysteine S-methyltransferase [Methyloversatilis sp. XJ19-49]MCQ9378860.1 methylated-DNA--[protein]-cysteine S-methyltransferase [Methyloversatilis sp. XJ19-49]
MSTAEDDWDVIVGAPGFALGVRLMADTVAGIEFLAAGLTRSARCALGREVTTQLTAYLRDPLTPFDLPLAIAGSAHQRTVWQVMRTISPGSTLTYGEVAAQIGSSPRAVGGACGANRFPVVIPCHRIVAAGGRLGGFAHSTTGFLPGIKHWLLTHEAAAGGFRLSANGRALSSRRPDAHLS